MTPGGIRADQNDQIGFVEIFVGAGHRVGSERAPMACHRRRHAEARIGVDVRRADEALHQLVGDVVILGEKLAGEIKSDGVGAVALGDALESVGDAVERVRPADARQSAIVVARHWMKQPSVEPERLAERRALRTKPAEICRVRRIARDGRATMSIGARKHATTHAAIRAGGANRRRMMRGCVHSCVRPVLMRRSGWRPSHRRRGRRACLSMGDPERMRLRYQRPSEVSPNSTVPMSRSLAMTSFL